VEHILWLLSDSEAGAGTRSQDQKRFLDDVARYGSQPSQGYKHDEMKNQSVYRQAYMTTFLPRLYDMGDPEIRLIRRNDLDGLMVLADRIQYGFSLPDRVNERNPVAVWHHEVREAVRHQLELPGLPTD
jgi:hypothetical protein